LKRYNFQDCAKEGLLRTIPQSKEKALESISTAKNGWMRQKRVLSMQLSTLL